MSPAEQVFLSDIRTNSDDDGLRLIYADWLQENGQSSRAEFIRVQLELARLDDEDLRRETLADRQDELLATNGEEWRSAFVDGPWPQHAKFHRGFLEEAVVRTQDEACAVLRSAPLRRLQVRKVTGKGLAELIQLPEFAQVRELSVESVDHLPLNVRRLFQSRHLAHLHFLSLSPCDRVTEILEALGSSPHLRALTRLGICTNYLGDEGLTVLARSPLLGRLNGLRLSSTEIRLPGLQVLLSSPLVSGLTDLDLSMNLDAGAAGGHAFADTTHLRHLNRLRLSCWNLGQQGAAALAVASHLGSLRSLDLSYNDLPDEAVRALALAPQWVGLRELDLSVNWLGPAGVRWLTGSPIWPGLTRLSLGDAGLADLDDGPFMGDGGAAALADSTSLENLGFWAHTMGPRGAWEIAGRHFPRLKALDLSFNQMGDEGFGHLLSRGSFPRLSCLSLQQAGLTAASVRALADSPLLDRLTELELTYNEIGDDGAAAIATSPRASRLRRLELNECGIGEEGARALAASPYLQRLQWLNLYQSPVRLPQDGATADALIRRFGHRVWF
jgi:uncharacterized protein (TIGR02996 family)